MKFTAQRNRVVALAAQLPTSVLIKIEGGLPPGTEVPAPNPPPVQLAPELQTGLRTEAPTPKEPVADRQQTPRSPLETARTGVFPSS